MHKLKHIWSHCETCGKSETYSAYTVHKRVSICECGDVVIKRSATSERSIAHPLAEQYSSLSYNFQSYALAWGA